MSQLTEAYTWQDRELLDSEGEKIGTVKEIYEDAETGQPEWALVSAGFFGTRSHFVPLAGAHPDGEQVVVAVTKQQIKDAPSIEGEGQLSEAEERQLFEHYGVPYTPEGSTRSQGAPTAATGYDTRDAERDETSAGRGRTGDDDAMTRSEEELHVGTAARERGRARLRKYVVTEQVQTTVPVQREEVRLEREPITDANIDQAMAGPEISEGEHEVVLHEEEPVVEKRVVPKERVRLSKDTVTDEREISEEVRKERIEPEDDIGR